MNRCQVSASQLKYRCRWPFRMNSISISFSSGEYQAREIHEDPKNSWAFLGVDIDLRVRT